jgi:microbial collagenase
MHCEYSDDSIDPQGAGTIAQWSWIFGDESTSNQKNPSHDYAAAGTYTVRLSVTDNRGAASPQPDEEVITVTVPDDDGGSDGAPNALIAAGRSR